MPIVFATGGGRSYNFHKVFISILLLLMICLNHQLLSVLARRNKKWKTSNVHNWECNREFSDIQSKFLQAPIVVRGDWIASDEQTPFASHKYNISITVKRDFKIWNYDWKRNPKILVGEFSSAVTAKNRKQQKKNCLTDLKLRKSGYLFFLNATSQVNYFQNVFLPVRNTKKNRNKIRKLTCKAIETCTRSPTVKVRKKVRVNQRRHKVTMRITCNSEGRPPPKVYWYKDGVAITEDSFPDIVNVYRKRGDRIIGRLKVSQVTEAHVGNYTCLAKNVKGSEKTTITIHLNEIAPMKPLTTTADPAAYLCRSGNSSFCLNGGTCYIYTLTGEPRCFCQRYFTGLRCENPELEHLLQYLIDHGYTRKVATVGGIFQSDNLTILILVILTFLLVFFSGLVMCFYLNNIRRRLDLENWKQVRTDRLRNQGVQVSDMKSKNQDPSPQTSKPPVTTKDAAVEVSLQDEAIHVAIPPNENSIGLMLPDTRSNATSIIIPAKGAAERDLVPTRLERPLVHPSPSPDPKHPSPHSPITANGPTLVYNPTNIPTHPSRSRTLSGSQPSYLYRPGSNNNGNTFQAEIKPVFDYTRSSESEDVDSMRLLKELDMLNSNSPRFHDSSMLNEGTMMDTNIDQVVSPRQHYSHHPMRQQHYAPHPQHHPQPKISDQRDYYHSRRSRSRSPSENDMLMNFYENPSFSNRSTPARRPYPFPGHGPPYQASSAQQAYR